MTPMERLIAESVPTGTFGGALPARRTSTMRGWTREEQARHLAELAEAVDEPWLRVVRGGQAAA
ncbi:hypothetical protein [Streptomyces sp. NPDC059783]|uniref:hypothetical protein n=1 Tax=Streptomyces sp. NPDC059783 TaxID=3346944 RepID=UPI00365575F0